MPTPISIIWYNTFLKCTSVTTKPFSRSADSELFLYFTQNSQNHLKVGTVQYLQNNLYMLATFANKLSNYLCIFTAQSTLSTFCVFQQVRRCYIYFGNLALRKCLLISEACPYAHIYLNFQLCESLYIWFIEGKISLFFGL